MKTYLAISTPWLLAKRQCIFGKYRKKNCSKFGFLSYLPCKERKHTKKYQCYKSKNHCIRLSSGSSIFQMLFTLQPVVFLIVIIRCRGKVIRLMWDGIDGSKIRKMYKRNRSTIKSDAHSCTFVFRYIHCCKNTEVNG